jgi:hypothetical protein
LLNDAAECRSTLAAVVAWHVWDVVGRCARSRTAVVANVVEEELAVAAPRAELAVFTRAVLAREAPIGRCVSRLRALASKRIPRRLKRPVWRPLSNGRGPTHVGLHAPPTPQRNPRARHVRRARCYALAVEQVETVAAFAALVTRRRAHAVEAVVVGASARHAGIATAQHNIAAAVQGVETRPTVQDSAGCASIAQHEVVAVLALPVANRRESAAPRTR